MDSDLAILKEFGNRISRYRLNQNKSQSELAKAAGVSLRTIVRLERGEAVHISSFIRVLRALQLLTNLDNLIPDPPISPIQQLQMQGRKRKRASSSKPAKPVKKKQWSWGDEE